MEIKLEFITGQDAEGEDVTELKTFKTKKIMSRLVVEALEVQADVNSKDFGPESLHRLADFACDAYANQFTRDQLYDGLESRLLIPTLQETMEGVINGVTKRIKKFPANK